MSACTTTLPEPFIHEIRDNLPAYRQAGYNESAARGCLRGISAHRVWQRTRTAIAFSPYVGIDTGTWTADDSAQRTFPEQMMDYCRSATELGRRCVLGNNSLSANNDVGDKLCLDAACLPIAAVVSGANRHDSLFVAPVLERIVGVKGPGRGRPRRRPIKLHADKSYDNRRVRRYLAGRGITARIARRGTEPSTRLGRHRWVVERSLAGSSATPPRPALRPHRTNHHRTTCPHLRTHLRPPRHPALRFCNDLLSPTPPALCLSTTVQSWMPRSSWPPLSTTAAIESADSRRPARLASIPPPDDPSGPLDVHSPRCCCSA